MNIDSPVTRAVFAQVAGVSVRQLQALIADGVIPSGSNGKLELQSAVQAWVAYQGGIQFKKGMAEARKEKPDDTERRKVLAELGRIDIEEKRMELDEKKGKLMLISEVERGFDLFRSRAVKALQNSPALNKSAENAIRRELAEPYSEA